MQKKLIWDFFPNFGFPRLNDQARQIFGYAADFLQGAKKNNEDQQKCEFVETKCKR